MGLIKDKDDDSLITGGEKLLSSDVDGTTLNITVNALTNYISSFITNVAQGGSLSFVYEASITPGASVGSFRLDNVDPTLATKIFFHTEDTSGVNTTGIFDNMNVGAEILVKQSNEFELYTVTASVDQTSYYEFSVTHQDSSAGVLAVGEIGGFTFFNQGAATSSPDNSLSEVDQTIPDLITRVVNTVNSGFISFRQDSNELMRVGGNNDSAVYIRAIEAVPATTDTVSFVSPIQLPLVDITGTAATLYNNALVKHSLDSNLYYSDGTSWFECNTLKDLQSIDQNIPSAEARDINIPTGSGSQLNINVNSTNVFRAVGNLEDRILIDGIGHLAGTGIEFFNPFLLPEIDTGSVAATLYPGSVVQDTGTVYYSNGTIWIALSPQATGDLIVKDAGSPLTISKYWHDTQANIDAIGVKDSETWYIPSNGVSPATPKSTASATAIDLETTGGHYYNMITKNTHTGAYTITGEVLGGWAKIYVNAASEPTVTGATKSGGIAWANSTDLYLTMEHNGNRSEYWFDTY